MVKFERQSNLFNNYHINRSALNDLKDVYINEKTIKDWQEKIINFQSEVFQNNNHNLSQYSLFDSHSEEIIETFNPLELTPLPLSFWKWPKAPHEGPAVYFVIDKTIHTQENIILYIGETFSASKRWKGDHDCKTYLSNYSEKLQKANLKSNLNIRFWLDVPHETKARRKLEQKLIKTWLPPFNKETRSFWSTPFTSQIN